MNAPSSNHLFPYEWRLADGFPAPGIQANGRKVFGTFVCGGGSAMGYKLAGYDYLGGVEFDARVAEVYRTNLKPKYLFVEDIRKTVERDDLPEELYHLDILDGSPPCTLFTLNRGKKREDSWGKSKVWKEGAGEQSLDDLCFVWESLVEKLRPKVCLMENVEGMLKGGAKWYLRLLCDKLSRAGYSSQIFLLNSATMGVPQSRRRVFVIGRRRDLDLPNLSLNFHEAPIVFGDIKEEGAPSDLKPVTLRRWEKRRPGDAKMGSIAKRVEGKESDFSTVIIYDDRVAPCCTTAKNVLYSEPRYETQRERERESTFPIDYNFAGTSVPYLTGMCVPPVMTAQIAHQIQMQWFTKID